MSDPNGDIIKSLVALTFARIRAELDAVERKMVDEIDKQTAEDDEEGSK